MKTPGNALAAASIALGAILYLGPLAAVSLYALGPMKMLSRLADNCGGAAATRCKVGVPTYPAADLVVVLPADSFVRP